jgi:hypothetical protein
MAEIRSLPGGNQVEILVTGTDTSDEVLFPAHQMACAAFLLKPLDLDDVRRFTPRLLSEPRSHGATG